jgi:deoxycytidylate deaminase
MLAKPCDQCWWLIEEIGFIKKVVYTTNEFPYFEIARVK